MEPPEQTFAEKFELYGCYLMFQEIFVSLIRLLRRGKSCILTHCPEAPPIHGGLDSSGE